MSKTFASRAEAKTWVDEIEYRGSTTIGRISYWGFWLIAWFVVVILHLLSYLPLRNLKEKKVVRRLPKIRGWRHLWTRGLIVIAGDHDSNWNFIWLGLFSPRRLRALQKISYFERRITELFYSINGSIPMPQPPKPSEPEKTKAQQSSDAVLAALVRKSFVELVLVGQVGVVFLTGTRRKPGTTDVGEISAAITKTLTDDPDVTILFPGFGDHGFVIQAARRGDLPEKGPELVAELKRRIQASIDEAQTL